MDCSYTILVWSTDSYEDTWGPFFQLFSKYWGDCHYPILLATETKEFSYPGLDIRCAKVGLRNGMLPPWGYRMKAVLSQIETEMYLNLDADEFPKGSIDVKQIDEFAAFMARDSEACQPCVHVGLTHRGSHSPFHPTEHPLLWEIDRNARYSISFMPGLWTRDALDRYIHPEQSAWDFEESSHITMRRFRGKLLTVNKHVFNPNGRVIYPFENGIVRGKWDVDAVEPVFRDHNIKVDFAIRGRYNPNMRDERRTPTLGQRAMRNYQRVIHRFNQWIDKTRSI